MDGDGDADDDDELMDDLDDDANGDDAVIDATVFPDTGAAGGGSFVSLPPLS